MSGHLGSTLTHQVKCGCATAQQLNGARIYQGAQCSFASCGPGRAAGAPARHGSEHALYAAAAATATAHAGVKAAGPDFRVFLQDWTPNDPRFAEQWHLAKVQAPKAWDTTTGSPEVGVFLTLVTLLFLCFLRSCKGRLRYHHRVPRGVFSLVVFSFIQWLRITLFVSLGAPVGRLGRHHRGPRGGR